MAKFYKVGGAVRDELLGVQVKDIDFAVEAPSFSAMRQAILDRGGKVFLETPQFFTIRAKVPKLGASDFVLCRKERGASDGRHPDSVEVGSLADDLARRDFTINAMARDERGILIDPFGGIQDLATHTLRTVGKARERFHEDYLRILRAIRFAVTKKMSLHDDIVDCLEDITVVMGIKKVSVERVREELTKAFAFDTRSTMMMFYDFPKLHFIFETFPDLWLKPTLEKP